MRPICTRNHSEKVYAKWRENRFKWLTSWAILCIITIWRYSQSPGPNVPGDTGMSVLDEGTVRSLHYEASPAKFKGEVC